MRDLSSRFPGDRTPAPSCDIHHVHAQAAGGDHHPDRLITLSKRAHKRIVHGHGWTITIDPATGATTFTCGPRRHTTMPWGTRLRLPPSDPDPPPAPPDP